MCVCVCARAKRYMAMVCNTTDSSLQSKNPGSFVLTDLISLLFFTAEFDFYAVYKHIKSCFAPKLTYIRTNRVRTSKNPYKWESTISGQINPKKNHYTWGYSPSQFGYSCTVTSVHPYPRPLPCDTVGRCVHMLYFIIITLSHQLARSCSVL